MVSEDWLADFQHQIEELQAKSLVLQEKLATAEGAATSPDGLITVRVSPNGAMKALRIDDRALRARGGAARLTAAIMQTYGRAQRQVSRDLAEALEPLAGDSELMDVVRSFLPPQEEDPAAGPPSGTDPGSPLPPGIVVSSRSAAPGSPA